MVIACRSVQTSPRLWKSFSSICVSSSLIPPEVGEVGVADAARTVETSDETSEVGVAEPVVAEEERPVVCASCGSSPVGVALLSSRGPRGVSERSVSMMGLGWFGMWRWRSSGVVSSCFQI